MQREKNLKRNLAIEVLEKADIVPVIRVELLRGKGVEGDPVRKILAFYLPNGVYIGEVDPSRDYSLNIFREMCVCKKK